MIDAQGRLFGRINVFDAATLLMLFLVALGILLVQSGAHVTSGQVVEGKTDIDVTLFLRNVKTLEPQLFKAGESLHITVRNQPRGNVEILNSTVTPKQALVGLPNGKAALVNDAADPYGYDYLVTIRDHAVVTQDGYVTNGIKVKVGMPIEVEGFSYRLPALVASIQPVADASAPASVEQPLAIPASAVEPVAPSETLEPVAAPTAAH